MLNIQIQPERSPLLDVEHAKVQLTEIAKLCAARCRVKEGYDEGRYINVNIVTNDLAALWSNIQPELQLIDGFAQASIICCEGAHGWDDYLLLHHFDPTEPLDALRI
jgi:hypothetical protein